MNNQEIMKSLLDEFVTLSNNVAAHPTGFYAGYYQDSLRVFCIKNSRNIRQHFIDLIKEPENKNKGKSDMQCRLCGVPVNDTFFCKDHDELADIVIQNLKDVKKLAHMFETELF